MKRVLICLFALITFFTAFDVFGAGYYAELNRATKRDRIFTVKDFSAALIWHTTFFDDQFRRAFEKKHIEINHLDALESARFIAEQETSQAEHWDFFIVFYTKIDYKDFSLDPNSFWKIFIVTESGEKVKPDEIDKVPVTPYVEVMYPYLNRWSKTYRVTFPKAELGKKFKLVLQSVIGDSEMTWRQRKPRSEKDKAVYK